MEGKFIPRGGAFKVIHELLDSDQICRDIVCYLLRNSAAADTAGGIAGWWIRRDVTGTARALAKLHEHGLVRSHIVQESISVYTLTKNRLLRKTLQQYMDGVVSSQTGGRTVTQVEIR